MSFLSVEGNALEHLVVNQQRGERTTMEIRRIDDTTLKFIFSEEELRQRGIAQDELFYNRSKGEQLLIDMMEMAYQQENFEVEGPLWIEAHMFDEGIEIYVTKGKKNKRIKHKLELSEEPTLLEHQKGGDKMLNREISSSQLENRQLLSQDTAVAKVKSYHSSLYKFTDIENVIQLSHRLPMPFLNTQLFRYDDHYYLVIQYPDHKGYKEKYSVEGILLEYGERCHLTIHRLEEYGKEIMTENAIATLKQYFKQYV